MQNIYFVLLIFPIALLIGRLIAKNTQEELQEINKVLIYLMPITIAITAFLLINQIHNTALAIIISIMILIKFLLHKKDPQEKTTIAIITSIAVFFNIYIVMTLCIILSLIKGYTLYEEKQKYFTKHTIIQTTLFYALLNIKFLLITII